MHRQYSRPEDTLCFSPCHLFLIAEIGYSIKPHRIFCTPGCSLGVSCRPCTTGNLPCHDSLDQYHTVARTMAGDSFHTILALPFPQRSNRLPLFWHRTQSACFTISHTSYIGAYAWLLESQWCASNDIHNAACATAIIM